MTRSILLALTLVLAISLPVEAVREGGTQLHVSLDGDDANPGTQSKPLGTLSAAQKMARARAADPKIHRVAVVIHPGTYFLNETLRFDARDSGCFYTALGGGPVTFSGGRRVTGWRKGDGEVWTAKLDDPAARSKPFRNLWVNGRRATRARFPNASADLPRVQLQAATLTKDLKSYTLRLDPKLVDDWQNPGDIEAFVDGNWAINRKRVQSVDPKTGTLVLAPPHRATIPWNQMRKGRWGYLENSPSFLDQPGEWYLDRRTGILSYWPLPGEDMAKAEVIAPVLTRLVEAKGTAEKPVDDLSFAGITFAHTDWQLPDVGYFGVQACHHVHGQGEARVWDRIPCAIRFDYAKRCSVRDGAIAHLGTGGIEFVEHCRECKVVGNAIFDVSANGVMLGGPKDEAGVPEYCRIANNHVHACGIEYHGAVGIWVGFAKRAFIVHNRVHDLPYTGISVGWQWNPQPTPCRDNLIESNHIFDVMKHLGDGGGIYTLGFQPGTIIRGNHIHDVRRSRFNQAAPNNGMFIDEGSKGFLFERNVIYRTAQQIVRFNQCRREWHTWTDNHFGTAPVPAPGKVGKALACDGSSTIVETPHKPALDPEQLTIEAWIRLDAFPTGKDNRRWIANKNDDEWIEGHYGLVISGDTVGAYLNIGGGEKNERHAFGPKGLLKLDTWHHAAFTYDGQDLKVYCDGKQVASTTIGKKRVPGKGPFAIGARQDRYVYFKGLIDEVRVYSRVLEAREFAARVARPDALLERDKGLEGHWSFDQMPDVAEAVKAIIDQAGPEPKYRERLLGK